MFKNAGEPNILDNNLIKKAKYVAIGMRAAGGGINMSWIPNITVGVVKAKNSSSLREFWWNAPVQRLMNERFTTLYGMERENWQNCTIATISLQRKIYASNNDICCSFGTWHSHFPNCKPGSNIFQLRYTWKVYI